MNTSRLAALHSLVLLCLLTRSDLSAAQFKFPGHTFTVPDGFEVELVAGPELAPRPVSADFDEQGRLYVTDSSGSNDKVEKQLKEKPHRVLRLEDTNGDGRFDQTKVFADRMMFPEGCLWLDGSVYVSAPPSIWKLTDTDGDGVADQRAEWFEGKTLTGCANDLHGPQLGPDGWVYWCKGAFAKQTYERPGKPPFVTRAAHVFRSRPDGSGIEPVFTAGMDNPVSVAFTAGGERLVVGTFFQHPEAGKRDGIIHAIYGGVYGKTHDVLDDHKKTGDLMPVLAHQGPAAPCSIRRYESTAFGRDYQNSFFVAQFNLHKVSRHVLESAGATFKTRDEDFLVSDNPDFHPTDVLEDADGSLLVVDTGGWYKLCCPTSQLPKPDVLGAIYRVRRTGAPKVNDPRGLRVAWAGAKPADLAKWLGDPRPAVRQRTVRTLARLGDEAVPAIAEILPPRQSRIQRGGLDLTLAETASTEARCAAVWALTQIDHPKARTAVRSVLRDGDFSVRLAAIHSAGLWRDGVALPELLESLKAEPPAIQRAAAEAIGRIGDRTAVPALLAAAERKPDRALEHSLIYALIETGDPAGTAAGLQHTNAHVRSAALIALDQMDGGGLQPEQVTPLLGSKEPTLKRTASWIVSHHPEWGGAVAGFFRERLTALPRQADEREELRRQLGQFGRHQAIQELLAGTLQQADATREAKLLALRAMAQSGLKEAPAGWSSEWIRLLAGDDADLVRATVAAARAVAPARAGGREVAAALSRVAGNAKYAADLRLEALAAVPGGLSAVEPDVLDFLRAHLHPAQPVMTRSAAASVLAKARLTPEQLAALTDTIKTVSPLELPKLLAAYERCTDEKVGLQLVGSLENAAGLAGLHPDLLKRLTNFPAVVQQRAEALLSKLNADAAAQKAHLEQMLGALQRGDIRRGQAVFNSQKAACASCHAIGYLGGKVGPDLTNIGQVRTERDLLEAILYPSASFVRSYEPIIVGTRDGDEFSGVLRRDAPDEVVLATGPDAEVRVARHDITAMRPGAVSVMPGGLDQQLSRQELADLLAFLKATRWGAQ